MRKVLICGLCPLPFENTRRSFGPGIRTWQFAHSLAKAGHEVDLVAMKIPGTYAEGEALREEDRDGVHIERLDDTEFMYSDAIRKKIAQLRPDCVVGATVYGAYVLAKVAPEVGFWADQFGHFMAEAQAKARLEGANWPISQFWTLLEPVLRTADKFSVVSNRQRYALMGELGVIGRLTVETCGYELTSVMPCALVPSKAEPARRILRGGAIPEDAFIVLWSGGYNVWSDVETLFRGMEIALDEDPRIHFVSTGGEIGGQDETTYGDFKRHVRNSQHRQRYHLQGWVEADLVASYQAESNLGVLTEIPIYEGILGSKNRIVQWMGHGLPVAYNKVGDLGDLLEEREMGLTFAVGDAPALAQRILWARRQPDELGDMAERAQEYTRRELSFEATTRDLVEWVEDPLRAPDADLRRTINSLEDFAGDLSVPRREDGAAGDGAAGDGAAGDGAERESMARVYVVTVHHQGREMLANCVESLLESEDVEIEIIVVSNACKEPLPDVVHQSTRTHVVTREVSLGFSAANNYGVAWALEHLGEPDFYYFINNDTVSLPRSLACLTENLQRRPSAAMAGPKLLILGAPDHYNSLGLNVTEDAWGWDEAIGQRIEDYPHTPSTRDVLAVTGSALLIDATVFHRIGGWTEVYDYYFEDIDLGIKVWKHGHQVINVPDAVVLHQISATMTEGSERKFFFFWRNRLLLALIHWPLGLLLRTFHRAFFKEILDRSRTDHPRLRKAMGEALRKLPSLMRCRFKFRGSTYWRRFLVPPGSVPMIQLPETETGQKTVRDLIDLTKTSLPSWQTNSGLDQQLTEARKKAVEFEALYQEAEFELRKVQTSKMWSLWMFTISLRNFLKGPFTGLRSLFSRG